MIKQNEKLNKNIREFWDNPGHRPQQRTTAPHTPHTLTQAPHHSTQHTASLSNSRPISWSRGEGYWLTMALTSNRELDATRVREPENPWEHSGYMNSRVLYEIFANSFSHEF